MNNISSELPTFPSFITFCWLCSFSTLLINLQLLAGLMGADIQFEIVMLANVLVVVQNPLSCSISYTFNNQCLKSEIVKRQRISKLVA